MLKWIVFPAAAIFMLVAGTIQFGPALGAAQGHATAGYFVAETENCSKDGCNWTGNFVAPDGQVTLRNVGFIGPHGTLYRGARLAALETGDTAKVYAAHGSRDWMADLAGIVFGVIGFSLWAWCVPYRTARLWARRNGLGDWHSIASLATRCLEGSDYVAATATRGLHQIHRDRDRHQRRNQHRPRQRQHRGRLAGGIRRIERTRARRPRPRGWHCAGLL